MVIVVVYFDIVDDTGNSCTWAGAGGSYGTRSGGDQELAPLPSRIESDKSKSGVGRGRIARLGRERREASLNAEALFPLARRILYSHWSI